MRRNTRPGKEKGFTLLEILVTVLLVSMVTLVVAMALRLGIDSWKRGEKEGDKLYLSLSIPSLMERQLGSLSQKADLSVVGKKEHLPFCGSEHALSFFTSFGPMGSPLQGLLRCTYVYDEDDETLYLFEKVITNPRDINEKSNPFSEEWDGELEPISEIKGVIAFDLMYSGQRLIDPEEETGWKKEWKCTSIAHPKALKMRLSVGKREKGEQPSVWYFHVGLPGSEEWLS